MPVMTNLWTCEQQKRPFQTKYSANSNPSSTPGSENYGKHMTAEEIIDFFAPKSDTTDAVLEWLVSSGISADRCGISANKQVRSFLQELRWNLADC